MLTGGLYCLVISDGLVEVSQSPIVCDIDEPDSTQPDAGHTLSSSRPISVDITHSPLMLPLFNTDESADSDLDSTTATVGSLYEPPPLPFPAPCTDPLWAEATAEESSRRQFSQMLNDAGLGNVEPGTAHSSGHHHHRRPPAVQVS